MNEKKLEKFFKSVIDELNDSVLGRIYATLQLEPSLRKSMNPAFPFPKDIRIGILKNCFAVEFVGPSDETDEPLKSKGIYNPTWDIYDFLEIDIKHLKHLSVETSSSIENMAFFLGDSIAYLTDYFYDFSQLPAEFIQINGLIDFSRVSKPIYISNTTFFWTNAKGDLKIKHIDFLEIFPYDEESNIYYHDELSFEHFGKFILDYQVPTYKVLLHKQLNEFIELINLPNTNEPQITKYLELNPEILQLSFGLDKLNPQIELKWQYETEKVTLKPDFLPVKMDKYSDIMEFKLPHLNSKPMVGSESRRHPSFEIDSAIAQIDLYEEWCSQEVNIRWLEKEKGIKILHPRRILIIGHSNDFSAEDRARLRKIRNTSVFTYNEFIELARYQIYRIK